MQLDTAAEQQPARIAFLVSKFRKAIERQQRHDGEVIAGLVRVLRNPRGVARVDVEAFREIIKQICEEKSSA
jgi:hypothetical protein